MTTTDLASIFAVAARGRFETFLDDPRWKTFEDGSRSIGIFFGEEEDGPAVFGYQVPSTYRFPAHFHQTHYMTVVLAGSMRVGRTWYRSGDIRAQEQGSVYGPEEAGPGGCTMLNIFGDRRGFWPSVVGADQPEYPAVDPDVLLRTVWQPGQAGAEAADGDDAPG
jgi:hypothetical protein